MMVKLREELEQRNIELANEERRLNELNQKYSLLKQNKKNTTILTSSMY